MAQRVFMPQIFGNAPPAEARHLFDLIARHPGQKRARCHWHDVLARVAQARAEDMGRRNYFNHTDPDGFGPNYHIRAAGYVLPDGYGTDAASNECESIAAGQQEAASVVQGWSQSVSHNAHMLGLFPDFAAQTELGCGYSERVGTVYFRYWVFISAP